MRVPGRRRVLGRAAENPIVVPARQNQQRHEPGGEQYENHGDAVDSDGIARSERRNPFACFDELELLTAGLEEHRDHDADGEYRDREAQRDRAGEGAPRGGHRQGHRRTDDGQNPQRRQPRKVTHQSLTANRAAATRAAPVNMDRA